VSEIANALITLHTGQVELARVVLDRFQDQRMRELAQQMLQRHLELNRQTLAFVDRRSIESSQTSVSSELELRLEGHEHSMQTLPSQAVGEAFLRQQASLYLDMLALIDNRMLPNADNAQLRNLLQQTRAAFAQQLSRAGRLQKQLLRSSDSESAGFG
jgi:predicted outer membrane protein